MAAGLVMAVVNPGAGAAAAVNHAADLVTTDGLRGHATWIAQQQDRRVERDATRRDLAGVATQAVAQVADVRARATQASVPADQLAALDSLEQQVNGLVAQVRAATPAGPVSRSAERASDEPATGADQTTAGADEPTAGADEPTAGADESTAAADQPTARADQPTAAADEGADDSAAPAADDSTPVAVASSSASSVSSVSSSVIDTAALAAALPMVAAADDPTAAALRTAVLALATQAAQVDAAASRATAQAAADSATAAQAAAEAESAATTAAEKASLTRYANGRIPASALCPLSFDASALLRCDAAQAMNRLDAAYLVQFGAHLTITDSYRSFAAQVLCRKEKGNLCAVPGTSNHGLGVAVDFGGAAHIFGTTAHDWLLANAGTYGWHLPDWAHADGSKPEPWHWEYVG